MGKGGLHSESRPGAGNTWSRALVLVGFCLSFHSREREMQFLNDSFSQNWGWTLDLIYGRQIAYH